MREDIGMHMEPHIAHERLDPAYVIARLLEVEIDPMASTAIPLAVSMPCCVQTDGRICGRGAITAVAIYNPDGTWLLIPICSMCTHEIWKPHTRLRPCG